jgi:hypothetical protein
MNDDARWLSYLAINLQHGGERHALQWIASHLGRLYSENEKMKREISSLKRKVTNLQKKAK